MPSVSSRPYSSSQVARCSRDVPIYARRASEADYSARASRMELYLRRIACKLEELGKRMAAGSTMQKQSSAVPNDNESADFVDRSSPRLE